MAAGRPPNQQAVWRETMMAPTARPSDGGSGEGDQRPTNRTALAVAESICGTLNWFASARLLGSRSHLRCTASAVGSGRVLPLLQRDAHAPVLGQGCADLARDRGGWLHSRQFGPWWITSPIRADLICDRHRNDPVAIRFVVSICDCLWRPCTFDRMVVAVATYARPLRIDNTEYRQRSRPLKSRRRLFSPLRRAARDRPK
jgi:hypothetical protein